MYRSIDVTCHNRDRCRETYTNKGIKKLFFSHCARLPQYNLNCKIGPVICEDWGNNYQAGWKTLFPRSLWRWGGAAVSERSTGLAISLIILPARDEPGLVHEATTKFLVTPLVTHRAQFRNTRRDTPSVVIIVARYSARSSRTRERARVEEIARVKSGWFVTLLEETEARFYCQWI